jgi:hypothetical protein
MAWVEEFENEGVSSGALLWALEELCGILGLITNFVHFYITTWNYDKEKEEVYSTSHELLKLEDFQDFVVCANRGACDPDPSSYVEKFGSQIEQRRKTRNTVKKFGL